MIIYFPWKWIIYIFYHMHMRMFNFIARSVITNSNQLNWIYSSTQNHYQWYLHEKIILFPKIISNKSCHRYGKVHVKIAVNFFNTNQVCWILSTNNYVVLPQTSNYPYHFHTITTTTKINKILLSSHNFNR